MHKLSILGQDQWQMHVFEPVFNGQVFDDGRTRLTVGLPAQGGRVFRALIERMAPPYLLLYVLHTPRGEGPAARYQSPPLFAQEVDTFLARFADYLDADARFDLWVHSPVDEATLVRDRHDFLFAYGPVDRFAETLQDLGFSPGRPALDLPHRHHYRAEFDDDARALLRAFSWTRTPLQPQDEQEDDGSD